MSTVIPRCQRSALPTINSIGGMVGSSLKLLEELLPDRSTYEAWPLTTLCLVSLRGPSDAWKPRRGFAPPYRPRSLLSIDQDVVIHAVTAVDTAPQLHRSAGVIKLQGGHVAEDQKSAAARAGGIRLSCYLVAPPVLSIRCSAACVGRGGRRESSVRRVGEQGHGDIPISRKYCVVVAWAFLKHVGQ